MIDYKHDTILQLKATKPAILSWLSNKFYNHAMCETVVGVIIFTPETLDTVFHPVVTCHQLLYTHQMLLLRSGTCFHEFSVLFSTRIDHNIDFDKLHPGSLFLLLAHIHVFRLQVWFSGTCYIFKILYHLFVNRRLKVLMS